LFIIKGLREGLVKRCRQGYFFGRGWWAAGGDRTVLSHGGGAVGARGSGVMSGGGDSAEKRERFGLRGGRHLRTRIGYGAAQEEKGIPGVGRGLHSVGSLPARPQFLEGLKGDFVGGRRTENRGGGSGSENGPLGALCCRGGATRVGVIGATDGWDGARGRADPPGVLQARWRVRGFGFLAQGGGGTGAVVRGLFCHVRGGRREGERRDEIAQGELRAIRGELICRGARGGGVTVRHPGEGGYPVSRGRGRCVGPARGHSRWARLELHRVGVVILHEKTGGGSPRGGEWGRRVGQEAEGGETGFLGPGIEIPRGVGPEMSLSSIGREGSAKGRLQRGAISHHANVPTSGQLRPLAGM